MSLGRGEMLLTAHVVAERIQLKAAISVSIYSNRQIAQSQSCLLCLILTTDSTAYTSVACTHAHASHPVFRHAARYLPAAR